MSLLQAGCNQFGFETEIKKGKMESHDGFIFIAESPIMKKLHQQIKLLSDIDTPVLILGDSGTGRTRTAYEIFYNSRNKTQNEFIKFVCHGFDQSYIEEKLFGNQGLLYKGSEVTLFIKGIEYLESPLQFRLLSFLLNPLNKKDLPRLICSSGDSFPTKGGCFSDSLFEALSQNILFLPALAERVEDIPYFISYFNSKNTFFGNFNEKALQILMSHRWEGNIKELQNICFQISVLHRDKEVITETELNMIERGETSLLKGICYEPDLTLEKLVNHYIQLSLDHFQSKRESAKALGISVKTIYNKIQSGHVVFSE